MRTAQAPQIRDRLGGSGQDALKRDLPLPEAGPCCRTTQVTSSLAGSAAILPVPASRGQAGQVGMAAG